MDNEVTVFPLEDIGTPTESLFPEVRSISVPANIEELATQVNLVDQSHAIPGTVEQTASNIQNIGMDEVRKGVAARERDLDIKVAESAVRSSLDSDTAEYYKSILDRHAGPKVEKQALEKAVVDIITPKTAINYYTDYIRLDNAQNLSARNILIETMSEASNNASFWDKVLSFGRDVVPFISARSTSKAVAEALNREAKFSDYFNTDEVINEFRNSYLNSAPEKRKEMIQALMHGVSKYSSFVGDPNAAVVAQNLQRILNQTAEEANIQTLFDVAGLPLITTAKILIKGSTVAADLGKPARVAIKAGNPELAAELMARDAISSSKVSGLSTDEIARKATSLNVTPLELTFDELGIAQRLQAKLSEFATTLRATVSDTLRPSLITDENVARGQAYFDELYSSVRNKSIYRYTPKGYQEGAFAAEVVWQTPDGVPFRSFAAAKQFGRDTNKEGFATLAEPLPIPGAPPAVMRPNRFQKKYITPDMPESEYLGRTVLHDENGPYFNVAQTPSWGRAPEVKENWVFVETRKDPLPNEARGQFALGDVLGRNALNFKIPMFESSIEVVNQRGIGASANAKIRRDLENAYKNSVKGISGKEQAQINEILTQGDALSNAAGAKGYVYSYTELFSKGLSEKGIESYYQQRMLRDTMWLYRNKEMVTEFRAGGYLEMAFDGNASVGPLNRPARPIPENQIKSLISNGRIGKVLNLSDGNVTMLTADAADDIYGSGGQVVRLYKPEILNGKRYTHLIVGKDDALFKDIVMPLPYRPGEFARVYTDEYFITLKNMVKDEFDNDLEHSATMRTAISKREAEDFVSSHNKALEWARSTLPANAKLVEVERLIGKYTNPQKFLDEVSKGEIPANGKFDFHYTRQTHSYMDDTIDESITNGRLFYSQRGEKLLSVDPTRANTLNTTDSLGVELANISRYITSKDIRVDAIEKWMNTFGDGIVNRNFNTISDFTDGTLNADKIKKALIKQGSELAEVSGDELLKFAESTRKYISDSLGLRTQAQKLNEARHLKMTEWIQDSIPTKFGDWFGPKLRKASVPDFIRSVNFNISLGMGNMAQLMVQANGMMIAVARHPIHGLGAAKTAIPLRMALMSDNPNVWKTMATIDNLTSLGLRNQEEFVDTVKAIRKSGLLADIRSTALYNVEDGALDLYKGAAMNTLKEAGTFFFNRGEEFSRLVSWEVSRREWIAKNPLKDWKSNVALREILTRQKEYNLGMQSHNTAAWQQGWAGIPTQFLQYNVKLLASLMHSTAQFGKAFNKDGAAAFKNFDAGNYRGFNPAEVLILLGSQVALYGAAGNGLLGLADEVFGKSDKSMTEEEKMYISEGLAGGLLYTITKEMDNNPAKLALGKRLGSFEWYAQIYDKIVNDKTDVTDFVFGVTKSNAVKMFDVMSGLARLFTYSDELTPDLLLSELSKAPEVIASVGNATKAYMYMQNEGYVTSKDGTPIARINTKENLAAFLGITSVQVQEYYNTVKDRTQFHDELKDIAKAAHKLQLRQWQATKDGDPKLANDLERLRWAMMPRDPVHRKFVERELKEKIWPGDTASDRIKREFVERMGQENSRFSVFDKEIK